MDDDAFFAQVKEHRTPGRDERKSKKSNSRVSIREERLSIKIKQLNVVDYQNNAQLQQQTAAIATKHTDSESISRNDPTLSGAKTPDELPVVKKGDEMKKIDITQCFGPATILTNTKWRPSYVIASKDNTLILRALVSDVEHLMTVRISFLINLVNKLFSIA